MITQEKIDNYNYMKNASIGTVLVKPIENLKDRNAKKEKTFRDYKDVKKNVADIEDFTEIIGIGINPTTDKILNHDAISYPYIEDVIKDIKSTFPNALIKITCSLESLNDEVVLKLQKHDNLFLALDCYDAISENDTLNILKAKRSLEFISTIKGMIPNIHAIYVPYFEPSNALIDVIHEWSSLMSDYLYIYDCSKENTHDAKDTYISFVNHLNNTTRRFVSKYHTYESLMQINELKALRILPNGAAERFGILPGDKIEYINDIKVRCVEHMLALAREFQICTITLSRNGRLFDVDTDMSMDFFTSIVFPHSTSISELNNLFENIFFNRTHSLILYPDYNIDAFMLSCQDFKLEDDKDKKFNFAKLKTSKDFIDRYTINSITFKDCISALNEYRENNKNELITMLFVPKTIIQNILDNGSDMSLEDFQIETMTFVVQI